MKNQSLTTVRGMNSCLSKVSVLRYWFVICSPRHSRVGGRVANKLPYQPIQGIQRRRFPPTREMTYKKVGNDLKGRGMNEVERGNGILSCKITAEPYILIIHTISYKTLICHQLSNIKP